MVNVTTINALKRARALIADPDKWLQHELMQTISGSYITETSEAMAVPKQSVDRCCLTGACIVTAGPWVNALYTALLAEYKKTSHAQIMYKKWGTFDHMAPFSRLARFNDDVSHAEVLALIDATIEEHSQ